MKYMKDVLKIGQKLSKEKPGVHHVRVAHDDHCAIFFGEDCNCNPKTTLMTQEEIDRLKQ